LRFWRDIISQGFIFVISIGKYEKRALNFAIQVFSTSFYFSKSLNFLKFLDKLEPINGNFDDCTKDILRDLYESSDSDEDDS